LQQAQTDKSVHALPQLSEEESGGEMNTRLNLVCFVFGGLIGALIALLFAISLIGPLLSQPQPVLRPAPPDCTVIDPSVMNDLALYWRIEVI
jgi:hypothetical protein